MPETDTRPVLARIVAAHSGVGLRRGDLVPQLTKGATRAARRASVPHEALMIAVDGVDVSLGASLDDGLQALPEHGLIAAIEDGDGRRGLLAFEHPLIDALIEVQTTGRVEDATLPPRPVTRIDEALCRDFLDLFLGAFAHETGDIVGRDWPERVSYSLQIKDRSQINLLLPARGYHLLVLTLTAAGRKTGKMVALLPTDPALARKNSRARAAPPPRSETWGEDMLKALGPAPLALNAVLMRMDLPLSRVEALGDGDLLPFDPQDLSRVTLEDDAGFILARGKLGQMNGRRAVRLGDGQSARAAPGAAGKAPSAAPLPDPEAVPGKSPLAPAPQPGGLPDLPDPAPLEAGGLSGLPDTTEMAGLPAMGDPPMGEAPAPEALPDLPPLAGFDPDAPMG